MPQGTALTRVRALDYPVLCSASVSTLLLLTLLLLLLLLLLDSVTDLISIGFGSEFVPGWVYFKLKQLQRVRERKRKRERGRDPTLLIRTFFVIIFEILSST